ncbi:hypothetical protein BsWGS_03999 [Bradybaena similaris]
MATAGLRLAGEGEFRSNCFPARYRFGRTSSEASGAWVLARDDEQKRRFKAVLCAKHKTYSQIKEQRKKSELESANKSDDNNENTVVSVDILDQHFLMKHGCVGDPNDLCSLNISSRQLTDVNEDDLSLFKNVAYVNAGENFLPFEVFRHFPSLRELEVPLNGLRSLKISHTDFSNLEVLDISYNNLSQDDLLTLGLVARLRVLHLTGNNLSNLPPDLAMPYLSREKQVRLQRFACLEVLLLDDNKLMDMAVFAALAGLPKLRHLDLAKNQIFSVPQLKVVEGRVVTQDGKERKRSKPPGSGRKSAINVNSSTLGDQLEVSANDADIPTESSQPVTSADDDRAVENDAVPQIGSQQCNTELRLEAFSTGDLSARIRNFVTENEESQEKLTPPNLPPFPELRYLNLSHNKIYEESGLMALGAWPALEEVDIAGNPLTMESAGDPPLLKKFLQEKLGIRLNRMKSQVSPNSAAKGRAEIRPKYMKITEIVPRIPKISVEEKMMLQLPPPATHKQVEFNSSSHLRDTSAASSKKSVLPSIASTGCDEVIEAETEMGKTQEGEENLMFTEDSKEGGVLPEQEGFDPFFMTQVNDADQDNPTNMTSTSLYKENHQLEKITQSNSSMNKLTSDTSDKYKGYELLLDIEELENEPELPPAKDIQANVRALRYTLDHLLVYPTVEPNKGQKMVQEYKRVPVPPKWPHQTYQQKVDQALTNLKTRSTVEEENVAAVLRDKGKLRKQFPEAEHLLGRVQRRYNTIRNHLIADAKQAGDIAAEVLELLAPAGPK